MNLTYYPFEFQIENDSTLFLIFGADETEHGNDPDEVFVSDYGRVPVFRSKDRVLEYGRLTGMTLSPEGNGSVLRLDRLAIWLENPNEPIDCDLCIDAWNLFSDLKTTLTGRRAHIDDQELGRQYDKLFWGLNLPAVTPEGEHYEPAWSDDEVFAISTLLREWLEIFLGLIVADRDGS